MTVRHTTIVIPKHRSDLFDSVSGNYVATQCARYDSGGLIDSVRGMVWCFVEWSQTGAAALETCRLLRESPRGELFFISVVLDGADPAAVPEAMRAGVDECIPGPLTPQTLRARIERRGLQRGEAAGGHVLEIGGYTVDLAAQRLFWQGQYLVLRPREFKIFVALLRNRNRLLSLEEIITVSGAAPGSIKKRTVHVWMVRLRRVLNELGIGEHIRSVRSMGYVLDYPDHADHSGHSSPGHGVLPHNGFRIEAAALA